MNDQSEPFDPAAFITLYRDDPDESTVIADE